MIWLQRDGTTGGISQPDVILLISRTRSLPTLTRISEAIVALELPAKDTYTVIATRQGGRTGKKRRQIYPEPDQAGNFNAGCVNEGQD